MIYLAYYKHAKLSSTVIGGFIVHSSPMEKIILSLVALLTGLLVAGVGFYFYQASKIVPAQNPKTISITPPTPSAQQDILLTISSPKDEEVIDKKSVTISGQTAAEATIIITSNLADEVIKPAKNGNFSTSLAIEDGQNFIEVTAVLPNGQEHRITRTVTYSTENF